MGSKTATASRNAQRQADTAELMSNIMTGGEISKKREAELQKAANYGRGIQFIPGSPTVKGLTQIDPVTGEKKPVFRTGATAADYTGRIVASAPTFSELLGDAGRALFGGTADKQKFTLPTGIPGTQTQDFANMVPDPQRSEGIIPALVNTGGITGLVVNALKDLYSSGTGKVRDFLSPPGQPQPDPFSSGADATGGAFVLPGSLVPQNIEREDIAPVDKRARLKELIERDVAPGSKELNVDEMTDREVDLRLQSYGEPLAVGGRVGFAGGGYTPTDYYDELNYKDYLEKLEEGLVPIDENTGKPMSYEDYEQDRAEGMMKIGGLVPPKSGPQSEGIESLFKNK
tara:strand:- start:336 stop:1367 length:1032 start_codon:yes stop_codon:yes gene_type:complete